MRLTEEVFGLEDVTDSIDIGGGIASGPTAKEILEAASTEQAGADSCLDAIETVQNQMALLSKPGAVDPVTAVQAQVAVEAIREKMGLPAKVTIGTEAFENPWGRKAAVKIAIESFKDTMVDLWNKFYTYWRKFLEYAVALLKAWNKADQRRESDIKDCIREAKEYAAAKVFKLSIDNPHLHKLFQEKGLVDVDIIQRKLDRTHEMLDSAAGITGEAVESIIEHQRILKGANSLSDLRAGKENLPSFFLSNPENGSTVSFAEGLIRDTIVAFTMSPDDPEQVVGLVLTEGAPVPATPITVMTAKEATHLLESTRDMYKQLGQLSRYSSSVASIMTNLDAMQHILTRLVKQVDPDQQDGGEQLLWALLGEIRTEVRVLASLVTRLPKLVEETADGVESYYKASLTCWKTVKV